MKCQLTFWSCELNRPSKFIYNRYCMLLLLLSRFSRVRLCATPQMAAHQAPLSLGFSRQKHWRGLPFPSPNASKWKVKVKSLSCVRLCATPCDPVDCSLPGSSVHGIFQARVLEWAAIAFSRYCIASCNSYYLYRRFWKRKAKRKKMKAQQNMDNGGTYLQPSQTQSSESPEGWRSLLSQKSGLF